MATETPLPEIYDEATYDARKGVGHLMHRVRTEMLASIDKELAKDEELGPLDVSGAQFIILATVGKAEGPLSTSSLCKGISYDAGAMTRMIDRLEDKGLLRRQRDPNDRRLVNLELTDAGLAAVPRMRKISMRVSNRFLRGFTRDEARQLEALLGRMLANAADS